MLKKINQPVSQNLVANDNKNLLKKTNQPVSQNLTANDYNYLSTGQNVGVSVSRTQKKAKSKSFRFRDIWGVHGFKRLSWALISLGVSAIPFFVILYGLLFKEDNGLKKGGYFDTVLEKMFSVSGGIGGLAAFFWIIPLILFLINGGGYLIYKFYKTIKELSPAMNVIADFIMIMIFIILCVLSAECIIIAIYTLVRLKNKDYLKK